MKKIIALVLALMMALSCVGAVADETTDMIGMYAGALLDSAPQQGYVVEMVQIDKDGALELLNDFTGMTVEDLGLDPKLVDSLFNIINACTCEFNYDLENKMFQINLSINDVSIVNFSVTVADGNVVILSNLIPSYMVTLSVDTLSALVEMLTPYISMIEEEIVAALPALYAAVAKLPEAFAPLATLIQGPFETGSDDYDVEYMMTVNASDLYSMLVDGAVTVLEDETVSAYITEKLGENPAESLKDAGTEMVADLAENDLTLNTLLYLNSENGNMYMQSGTLLGEQVMYLLIRIDGTNVDIVCCTCTDEVDLSAVYENAHTTGEYIWAELFVNVAESYTYLDLAGAGIVLNAESYLADQGDDYVLMESDLYINYMPILIEINGFSSECEFLEGAFETDGLQVFAIESLLGGDEEAANLLLMDLSNNGLASVLGSVFTAAPEDATNLLGLLTAFIQ